jgi:hypothetical protein
MSQEHRHTGNAMNTLPSRPLDGVNVSPLHALIRTVLQALHLVPRPGARDAVAHAAAPTGFVYEQAFVTEQEARAFAQERAREGYRAEVEQDIYDYSWSVEVFQR